MPSNLMYKYVELGAELCRDRNLKIMILFMPSNLMYNCLEIGAELCRYQNLKIMIFLCL